MHVSFSLIHPERADAGERAVRGEAQAFLIRSGARLIEALRLVGGEEAIGLGYAFRDIVLEAGFSAACSHDRCQFLFHGNFSGDAGYRLMWMRRVGDGTEDDG